MLLSKLSERSTHPGTWTLPGGGLDHGEAPLDGLRREVHEETGLDVTVGGLLDVHSLHHEGVAPDGVLEDFHALRIVYAGTVSNAAAPRVVEENGTTAAAAWLSVEDVKAGRIEVADIVALALAARDRTSSPPARARGLHGASDVVSAPRPDPRPPSWNQRIELLREAFEQYVAAAESADALGVADALADMSDVIDGTALVYGIPLDSAPRRV